MDAVTLTLPKALELASILSKYVDVKKLDPQADPVDFIRDIVNAIAPNDYLRCVMLLTQKDEKQIEQEISLEILTAFIEGLKKNQVIALIFFYKSLGF
jgi:hypothetical protein